METATLHHLVEDSEDISFRFVEFNPRRKQRRVEAVRMEVTYGPPENGKRELLWMNKADIRENIKEFGTNPELQKALDAYNAPASA